MYHSAWWFPSIYFCVFLGETTNQQIRMRLHTWHRMRPPLTITPRKLNTQRERRCFFFCCVGSWSWWWWWWWWRWRWWWWWRWWWRWWWLWLGWRWWWWRWWWWWWWLWWWWCCCWRWWCCWWRWWWWWWRVRLLGLLGHMHLKSSFSHVFQSACNYSDFHQGISSENWWKDLDWQDSLFFGVNNLPVFNFNLTHKVNPPHQFDSHFRWAIPC